MEEEDAAEGTAGEEEDAGVEVTVEEEEEGTVDAATKRWADVACFAPCAFVSSRSWFFWLL